MNDSTKKRLYPSQQLVCCLDANALKVLLWFVGWQSQGDIKIYPRQMTKYLHLDEETIALAIQTLINAKLILIRKEENYIVNLNKEQFDKYFSIPISKIPEGKGIPMADEVTWNKTAESTETIEDNMSDEELERTILLLQARLNERKQLDELIKKAKANELFAVKR